MACFTLRVFPDVIGSPVRQHYRLRSHKRHIRGESGRLNHDDHHLHLYQIVIISIETWLAFWPGIIMGCSCGWAHLAFNVAACGSSIVHELHWAKNIPSAAEAYTFWVYSFWSSWCYRLPPQWSNYGLKTPNHLTTLNCLHSVVCQRWQGQRLSLPTHLRNSLSASSDKNMLVFSMLPCLGELKSSPGFSGCMTFTWIVCAALRLAAAASSLRRTECPARAPGVVGGNPAHDLNGTCATLCFPHLLSCSPLICLVKAEVPWKS